jgi:hypothetical protein
VWVGWPENLGSIPSGHGIISFSHHIHIGSEPRLDAFRRVLGAISPE